MRAQASSSTDGCQNQGKRLAMTLESSLNSADVAESAIRQFTGQSDYSERQREEIVLAVRESVVNAVLHGNQCNVSKKVLLTAELRESGLVISVQDEGPGFDPGSVPDPLNPENLMRASGRGVFLMRCFMDEVSVRQPASCGLEVTMIKYFSQTISKEDKKVSLKASSRLVDGVTIVDLSGRLVLGEATGLLRDSLQEILSRGQHKILLNLGDVSYIDSSGLGTLVSGYSSVTGRQGQLKLLNLTKKVHDLLQVTKLLTVFEVFNDEAAAVKSFS